VAESLNRFTLAAIDLDGTLLGPDHAISMANAEAVRRLQAAGAQVVLASGRHFESMRKYVDALPGVQWVVSCQGGEVSSADRQRVLSRQFLPATRVGEAMASGHDHRFAIVAYGVEGVFTDSTSNFEMEFYTELVSLRPAALDRNELLARDIFKVIWIGEPADIARVVPADVALPQVQMVRTNARFLEFMPESVSKGAALANLAAHLGLPASEAVVFGDGDNDVPMFEWAGMSVAMPQGSPLAHGRAKRVAPAGPAETALARAVNLVL
jgi:Cof subfamily protein (haloacid dehalogenase superfamily)